MLSVSCARAFATSLLAGQEIYMRGERRLGGEGGRGQGKMSRSVSAQRREKMKEEEKMNSR